MAPRAGRGSRLVPRTTRCISDCAPAAQATRAEGTSGSAPRPPTITAPQHTGSACRAQRPTPSMALSRRAARKEAGQVSVLRYEVGVNLLYPKISENGSKGSEFRELCLMLCSPLNRKTMGISIHVRGITKWGRRDSVTAHGLRTDCQQ